MFTLTPLPGEPQLYQTQLGGQDHLHQGGVGRWEHQGEQGQCKDKIVDSDYN